MTAHETHSVEILGDGPIGLVEIISYAHVERDAVIEMVDVGLLEPGGASVDQWRFAARDLRRLRAAQRLIDDLGVNICGAAVILDLIEQRDELLSRAAMLDRMLSDR
jgi:chaperone modulatory protein CbpM